MSRLPLHVIDSFTDQVYGGNPCAVVFDADHLSDEQMQTIAREMNLSETAFVMESEVADFKVRFFTITAEIPVAGHPTIATIAGLLIRDQLVPAHMEKVCLEMRPGLIDVEIQYEGAQPLITMIQNEPQFLRRYDKDDVAPAFGLDPSDLLAGYPCLSVSTGTPLLMVPVASMARLLKARVNVQQYQWLHARGDFFSAHLFVCEGYDERGDTFARHFVLPPDVMEDPFTGSATGAMAAYLWRFGLIRQKTFTAQQGHGLGRPGQAQVELAIKGDAICKVRVGGYAAEVVRGEIRVPVGEKLQ